MIRGLLCVSILFYCVSAQAQEQADGDVSITILPVEVRTIDPDATALAAHVTRELHSWFGTIDGLRVIDRDRVQPLADSGTSAAEIARELGTNSVLAGGIETDPQFFILELRHIDAETGDTYSTASSLIGVRHDVERSTFDSEQKLAESMERITESVRSRLLPDSRSGYSGDAASARRIFLDTGRSDQERLRALQELTPARASAHPPSYVDGGAALRGEIAQVAVQLAADSDDVGVRIRVWSTMAGVGDPQLVEPLLDALANDSHFDVRSRAARTLVDFIDEPRVRDALDRARRNDSSARVREAARSSLYSATL